MEQEIERADGELEFSRCLITLMKGVVEREAQPMLWNNIVESQARIAEYVEKIGLRLYLDKGAGYAYLRQTENENLPRLVNRHQLSFGLSMLLIILRKSLGDFDAATGDSFFVIKKSDIQLKLKGFFPAVSNETKYIQEIDRHIKRAIEMGFLVPLKGEKLDRHNEELTDNSNGSGLLRDEAYEVKEIIRSFITADWLKNFEERLNDYIAYANGLQVIEDDGPNLRLLEIERELAEEAQEENQEFDAETLPLEETDDKQGEEGSVNESV